MNIFRKLKHKMIFRLKFFFIAFYYLVRHPRRFWHALSRRGKKWAMRALITLLIILIAVPVSFWYQAKHAKAGWWNEDWMYRKIVTVTNGSGSSLTDFQVLVTLDTSTLISANKLQSTCNDIRVTDIAGKLLPYWIETGAKACNTSATNIWVKAASVPSSGENLYVYYGNSAAVSNQNGNNVFEFFDDFSGSSVDTSKWSAGTIAATGGTQFSESGGNLVGGNNNRYLQTNQTFTGNYISETRIYENTSPVNGFMSNGFYASAGNNFGILVHNGTTYVSNDAVGWVNIGSFAAGQWARDKVKVVGTAGDVSRTSESSGQVTGSYSNSGISGEGIRLSGRYDAYAPDQNYVATWDWIMVRKAVTTEPTTTPGAEEKGPAPVVHWKMDEGFGTTTRDSTVNHQDQSFTGTPTWETSDKCISGECLNFDTDDSDYATYTVPSSSPLNLGASDFTISHWQKVFQPASFGSGIIGRYAHNTSYNGNWSTGISDDRTTYFFMHRNMAGSVETYGTDYSAYFGKWANVSWVKAGSTLTLYIDGKFKQQWTPGISFNIDFTGAPFYLGQTGWSPGTMSNLTLDDLKIYNYARTANQVKQDYAAGTSGNSTPQGSNVSVGESPKWMTDGLAGYWKMDDASGNAVDSSGNGNTGIVTGAPSFISGKVGSGKNFANTAGLNASDYYHIASMTGLSTEATTISVWINPDVITSGERQCIVQTPGTFLDIEPGGSLTSYFQTNPTGWGSIGTSGLQAGVWQHIVQTYDRNERRLYINGELKSSDASVKEPLYNTGAVRWGDASWGTEAFDGKLQEARIYNRVLSADEVKQLSDWGPGPTAYYNFDESSGSTVNDHSGHNLNLAIAGSPTFTKGKYDGALQFHKNTTDSAYLQNSQFKLNDYTYGFWYKMDSTQDGNFYQIMQIWGTTDREPAVWHHMSNDCLHARENPSNEGFDCAGPTGVYTYWTAGQWYYFSQTKSGTSLKYYVNGVERGSTTVTDPMASSANPTLYLGKGESNSAGFTMDEFRLYNYARTPKQITEDMNAGHPIGGSPLGSQVAYWKMDEGYGTTAYNSISGNGDLTLWKGPSATDYPTWQNSGKFGKALQFGSSEYPNNNNAGLAYQSWMNSFQNATWSFWINPSNLTGTQRIISRRLASGSGYVWEMDLNNEDIRILVSPDCSAGNEQTLTATNSNLATSQWQYITIAHTNGSDFKVYKNGVLTDTLAYTGGLCTTNTSNGTYIGTDVGVNGHLAAQMDEIKFYNSALTPEQIRLDMNQGKALQLGGGQTSATGATGQASQYCVPGDATSCSGPIAEWKFDENTGTAVNDTSGNGRNGSFQGSTSWAIPGKYGSGAYTGNTTGDSITVPNVSIGSAWTAEAWFKYPLTTTGNSWNTLFRSSVTDHQVIVSRGDMQLGMYDNATGGGYRGTGFIMSTLSNGWHHLAVSGASGTQKFYVDGKYVGQTDRQSTQDIGVIGNYQGGSQNWGYVDNVLLFNYVRTPAQVAWDYNRGGPVGWWKFDEGEDVLAHDFSGNGNTGTMTSMDPPNDWVAGKFEKALDFDGSNDYVSAGTSLTDSMESAGSISMWIYPNALGGLFSRSVGGGWTDERCVLDFYSTGGLLDLTLSNGTSYWRHLSNSVVPTGVWTHVVVTWDGTNVKHYFNGKLDRSQAQGGIPEMTGVKTWIGRTEGLTPDYFNGKMDDVRAYNYALTAEQVKQVMNNGAAVRFGE